MVIAVLSLGLLIFSHELGHYAAARSVGVLPSEFSVGFGPLVASRPIAGTEFSLRMIPLGGYVNIGRQIDLVPPLQKIIISAAGPVSNLLVAYLLFAAAAYVGVRRHSNVIARVLDDSPASLAGLQARDRIVAVNDSPVIAMDEIVFGDRRGGDFRIAVERGGCRLTVVVPASSADNKSQMGIVPNGIIKRRYGSKSIHQAQVMMSKAVGGAVKSLRTIMNRGGESQIGGPVMVARAGAEIVEAGKGAMFHFVAIMSVNLFLINLLPLPFLDGSTIVISLWELLIGECIPQLVQHIITGTGFILFALLMVFVIARDLRCMKNPEA